MHVFSFIKNELSLEKICEKTNTKWMIFLTQQTPSIFLHPPWVINKKTKVLVFLGHSVRTCRVAHGISALDNLHVADVFIL